MNAGIADAANLAWLLAACCAAGPPAILDAYEAERLPITEQVSRFAMNHSQPWRAAPRRAAGSRIPASKAPRARRVGRGLRAQCAQYCCSGFNFGYFYDRSPIVRVRRRRRRRPLAWTVFTPSTVPGLSHALSVSVATAGRSMTGSRPVILFDADVAIEPLLSALRARRAPIDVVYPHALHLARSPDLPKLVVALTDQHVASRRNALPHRLYSPIDTLVRRAGCHQVRPYPSI